MTIGDFSDLKQALIEREKQIPHYARNDRFAGFPGRLEVVEQVATEGFE